MDAKQVIDKILADANAEAEKIKAEAAEEQNVELRKFEKQLDQYRDETRQKAEKAAEDTKAHMAAAARMSNAMELLAEKRNILDQVFETALQNVKSLPDDQYLEVMSKLMVEAAETGDEQVIVDKDETRIDQKFINEVNRKLPGGKGNLKLSDRKQNIGGGFILQKGRIKVNASMPVLLAQAKDKLEMELSKEIFS